MTRAIGCALTTKAAFLGAITHVRPLTTDGCHRIEAMGPIGAP